MVDVDARRQGEGEGASVLLSFGFVLWAVCKSAYDCIQKTAGLLCVR